jgi:uncharacterized protein with PIN domain
MIVTRAQRKAKRQGALGCFPERYLNRAYPMLSTLARMCRRAYELVYTGTRTCRSIRDDEVERAAQGRAQANDEDPARKRRALARANLADCLHYACAKARGVAILTTDEGFALTNLPKAP